MVVVVKKETAKSNKDYSDEGNILVTIVDITINVLLVYGSYRLAKKVIQVCVLSREIAVLIYIRCLILNLNK